MTDVNDTQQTYALRRQAQADAAYEVLSRAVNGGTGYSEVANAVFHDHPTLSGQVAKAVAVGIMRRTTRNPDWKPFDGYGDAMLCDVPKRELRLASGFTFETPDHPMHDGRWDCETVIGAELMARQGFI